MLKGLSGRIPAEVLALFVILLSMTGTANASAPIPLPPVDDLVEISYPSGARVDRATGNLNVPTRITNVSSRTLSGPLRLTISNVDSSMVGPLNPDGVDAAGDPFFDVLGPGARLNPGASADELLRFTPTSRRARLRFDTSVSANTLEVAPPGILPLALPAANTTATLTITAVVSNPEGDPLTVTAQRIGAAAESAVMNDSGTNGDRAVGDGVYSGRLDVDYTGLSVGQCVRVTVTATSALQSFTSSARRVCITAVPIGAAGAVIETRVPFALEPGGGEDAIAEAVGDEALVQMRNSDNPGFPEATLESLGDTDFFDFEIVGFIPPFYQIRFNSPFDDADDFLSILSELEGESEVVLAIPNFIASPLAFDPAASRESDPDTVQDGWERIRIGNAWNIARGRNANVHVLDSGFDNTHDDLDAANITGDPDLNVNANGHGTQVLGILAAEHA
ncbi:MAG: hypothetical protein KJO38_04075, partial [Gammaproteobacteria bacterium]|nr:hypothetical protein [Gammaproteobacteria bacterium]